MVYPMLVIPEIKLFGAIRKVRLRVRARAERELQANIRYAWEHVTSEKNGIDAAKQRNDVVKSIRAKREKENFG